MRSVSSFIAFILFFVTGAVFSADGAPLGSPQFKPTPEHPVGWRGDWTGRYTAATPPLTWSRRVAGITTALRYQALKPAGEPGKDAKALEYFTIKDWLVAGPFSAEDPAKGLETDYLGGESGVQPNENDKAGESAWKFLRADIETQSRHDHNEGTCGQSYVDFVYAFGKLTMDAGAVKAEGDFTNKVGYAHTYVYSPAEAKVQLQIPFTGASGRFWFNGKPTDLDRKTGKSFDVTLAKGWNRLLLKITIDDGLGKNYDGRWLSKWLVAAYFTPMSPVTYDTKNINWMTKLTGRSMSQPIVVGDKIFVGSAISDLICISKKDGKVLWIQPSTPWDGLTAEEKADPKFKEKIEPLLAKWEPLNKEAVTLINAAISSKGLSSSEEAALDVKLKARITAERAVHAAFASLDRKKYPALYENEVSSSNPTPCSDGTYVYWICGGGMKGPGGYVIACFDLDGKRIWSRYDAFGAQEHGNHTSPALIDGKLIFAANKVLYAFDVKTGKELWQNSPKDWQNGLDSVSPVVVKVGSEYGVLAQRFIHRVSDGSVICPSLLDIWGNMTPVVDNGVIYNPCRFHGWKDPASFVAVKVPASPTPVAKPEVLYDLAGKDVTMPIRMSGAAYTVASPLFHDGVVYSIEMSGGLAAVDTTGKKSLYRRWLDGYNRYNRFLYGVAASPTLGGKNIYIIDDAGYTHIIEPGAQFKEIARNVLENLHFTGSGGNPCKQESFYTSPFFEGKIMYLRGEDYLYCIEEK